MGKPTTRRYSPEEKASAVRMVRTLRAELGTEHGTVQRVALQLCYGVESVRMWVKQAAIDEGHGAGVTMGEARRVRGLEKENRELWRVGEILKRAASFFGAEPGRQHRKWSRSSTPTRTYRRRSPAFESNPSVHCC